MRMAQGEEQAIQSLRLVLIQLGLPCFSRRLHCPVTPQFGQLGGVCPFYI